MQQLHLEMQGVHESVQQNATFMEHFAHEVQVRVEQNLQAYKEAIHSEFVKSGLQVDHFQENMALQLQNVALQMQEKVQKDIMHSFTNYVAENSSFCQGLVKMQADMLEGVVKSHVLTERKHLEGFMNERISEIRMPELLTQVELRFQTIKTDLQQAFGNFTREVVQKFDELLKNQAKLERNVETHEIRLAEFREQFSQRSRAVDQGILFCLQECQKLREKVSVSQEGVGLSVIKEEIAKVGQNFSKDVIAGAEKQGKLHARVENLEKTVDGVQETIINRLGKSPGFVLVQPPVIQKTTSTMDGQADKPLVQIVDLLPLSSDEGVLGMSMLGVKESLLSCVDHIEQVSVPRERLEMEIRPVEIGVGTSSIENLGLLNFPVAAHLSRSQIAPKFSNKKEDWNDFLWKFDTWVRAISSGRTLGDNEMLQLLNSCFSEVLQKEMQLWEREKRRIPSYVEF